MTTPIDVIYHKTTANIKGNTRKTQVSIYIDRDLARRAKERRINISQMTERMLTEVLAQIEYE